MEKNFTTETESMSCQNVVLSFFDAIISNLPTISTLVIKIPVCGIFHSFHSEHYDTCNDLYLRNNHTDGQ